MIFVLSSFLASYSRDVCNDNIDYIEALAAKDYFQEYHKGLNRRGNDPVNNR